MLKPKNTVALDNAVKKTTISCVEKLVTENEIEILEVTKDSQLLILSNLEENSDKQSPVQITTSYIFNHQSGNLSLLLK